MNERIDQLAEDADLFGDCVRSSFVAGRYVGTINVSNIEKFYESIVNHAVECVRDVMRNEQSALTYTAGSEVQARLREYFGVKE